MPRFNGTGPLSMGPMTGRGFGPCGLGTDFGRSYGRGRGLGRYFGWGGNKSRKDQIQVLKDYKRALEEEIEDTEKELKDLGEEK